MSLQYFRARLHFLHPSLHIDIWTEIILDESKLDQLTKGAYVRYAHVLPEQEFAFLQIVSV